MADEIPRPAIPFCMYFGSIVAWVTLNKANNYKSDVTNVVCNGKLNGKRCYSYVIAGIGEGGVIWYECSQCGSNGHIQNWEMTEWDRRKV